MRERVGASDHEGIESKSRIERRAAERLMGGLRGLMCGAQLTLGTRLEIACRFDWLVRLHLESCIAQHRRAMHQIDPADCGEFGFPAGEQLVGVVRLHPALEKTCRERKPHDLTIGGVMLERAEPALEILVADGGAQASLYPRPTFLI